MVSTKIILFQSYTHKNIFFQCTEPKNGVYKSKSIPRAPLVLNPPIKSDPVMPDETRTLCTSNEPARKNCNVS